MAAQRSDQQTGGRYVQGGTVDVNGSKLGWWERTIFPTSPLDVPFIITAKYAYRPDLLAYDVYGKATLQWFILQYNNVVDINVDFAQGVQIYLPTKTRLYSELLSTTGF